MFHTYFFIDFFVDFEVGSFLSKESLLCKNEKGICFHFHFIFLFAHSFSFAIFDKVLSPFTDEFALQSVKFQVIIVYCAKISKHEMIFPELER